MAKTEHPSRNAALATLPDEVRLTATFGNAGEGGYSEYWRAPDGRRWRVSNGKHDALRPFTWTVEEV